MPAPLPPLSSCLPIAIGGSRWQARRSFQNIVVFGDSYSKSSEGKTWVDHLRRRMRSDQPRVYNFAFSGATAEDDLSDQLSRFFERFSCEEDNNQTPALDPDGTIYFVFLGINDCGTTERDELDSIVDNIFDTLHHLYVKAGARNFVLFDIPPIDRSPQAIESESVQVIEDRVKTWNEVLQAQTTEFGLSSKEATVLLFSPHQVLTDVLEDPLEYDFSEDDPSNEGGCIWMDDLHLTSEVHDILGERLLTAVLG
ncbi:SGNH hydrolase-type esterase domain-containing protein [Pholiota molesta]|nr:SGNH hydrolase-type esterase domain-containing protein [Pholiota molesta]